MIRARILSGCLGILLLSSCAIAINQNAQEVLIKVVRHEQESKELIERLKARTAAEAVSINIYTPDLTKRIRYLETGNVSITRQRMYTDTDTYRELLDYHLQGEEWWQNDIDSMSKGVLKTRFLQNGVTAVIATPIYNDDDLMIGYIGASWREGERPGYEIISSEFRSTAAEITRLNGIF